MSAYEEGVNTRREKLREILLREEMGLTREVVDQAQHGDDARMDEMRQRKEELHKEQEEQRLALVAAKRMQQYLAQVPEIRQKLVKKSTVEAKLGNLAQMADNEAKRQADKELDRLWHELMLKDVEAKKEREVEEAKKRCLVQQETLTTLAKQMAGKLALEEQKKQLLKEDMEYMEQVREMLRKEELERLEKERQNRENLKRDLQEQILLAKRRLAEQAQKEKEMEQLQLILDAQEMAKEQSKIQETSAALRRELLAYLQYLEDLRKEEVRRNVEVDRIVEQAMKDASLRRDLAVKEFKEARQRGLQEVLRGLEEQLRLKSEKEKEELEQRRLEKEALEKEMELEAKLAANAKEEAKCRRLCYRKELEEQWKLADEARRQAAGEDEKFRLEEEKRQEEYQKLTEELLKASENITPHPFKILLKECAARYAAEKEGHCYCPPPLNGE
ncbi:uncharacterized protein LOC143186644 [Calliopsis andreniformis]|uniref:uncharacterized protein LOC143186644 n=1 Tax=Calliopsis andreniformis TaxID=337506 RepID=UPI003FCEA806